jgi:hypothetical protein
VLREGDQLCQEGVLRPGQCAGEEQLGADGGMRVAALVGLVQARRGVGEAAIHGIHECHHVAIAGLVLRRVKAAILLEAEACDAACRALEPKAAALVEIPPRGGTPVLVEAEFPAVANQIAAGGIARVAGAAIGLKFLRAGGGVADDHHTVQESGDRQVRVVGIVEVAVGIRRNVDRIQEILELPDLCRIQRRIRAHERDESIREARELGPVAGPVHDGMIHRILEGRGQEGALHRRLLDGGDLAGGIIDAGHRGHGPGGIAKVPYEAVRATVHMAGGAGDLAEAGGQLRIVKEGAADLDDLRRGIKERNSGKHRHPVAVHHGDGGVEFIEHVKLVGRRIDDDAGGALADIHEAEPSACPADLDDVIRAHAGDPCPGAIGTPRDAARIADGKLPLGDGHIAGGVIEMRVEIGDGIGPAGEE